MRYGGFMKTRKTLLVALFCALFIVGAFIRFPLPPIPFTLQTLFILACALLLPWDMCLASILIYLLLGTLGLPVFTSGGGLGALLGPTGGFLLSWPLATVASSLVSSLGRNKSKQPIWDIAAVMVFTVIMYGIGVPYLKFNRDLSWKVALGAGMFPFLLGDTLKAIAAILIAKAFRGRIAQFLMQENEMTE